MRISLNSIFRLVAVVFLSLGVVSMRVAQADEGRIIGLPTGASLFVEMRGAGHPILMLHGGLGLDHRYFQPWLDPLQGSSELVYPDLRGNGLSTAGADSDFTLDHMVDDLDALRTALKIKQWDVLGHSYGGFLAQAYALKYPDAVSHLVLVDTSPAPRLIPRPESPQLLAPGMTPQIAAALKTMGAIGGATRPEGGDAELKEAWHTVMPVYFHDFPTELLIATDQTVFREHAFVLGTGLVAGFDTRAALPSIAVPTMVAVGKWDAILPVSHSEVLHKAIPGAELVVFDRSGHFPFIEERDRFLEVIRSFLGR